ncbi:MAG: pyridoxal phosphate-dependent aminotransferase [Promethearchaeota archaeon]
MKIIKLNMSENPYLPPPRVKEAAQKGLALLNRYTNPQDLDVLRDKIAHYANVSKKHIILSPGSDLLLREIIHLFSANRKVIMVNPSFFPIASHAKKKVKKLLRIQLRPPNFELDSSLIINEIKDTPTLIIIDNPNNPTGKILLNHKMVTSILEYKNALLVIDEAYYEFSQVTYGDLVESHPNLAVVRTLDKAFSLAGVRIGYLIAGDIFLSEFSTFFMYLPQVTLYSALEALKNPEYIYPNINRIIQERNRMKRELEQFGISVFSSDTNFLLMKIKHPKIVEELEKRGILVSDISQYWLPGYIRVSIGTPQENDIFLSNLKEILSSSI